MSTLMQDARHAPLAEVTRGEAVESLHAGSVAVVDTSGRVLYAAGDPECLTFTRSTIKPFQAAPFIAAGGAARFGLDAREIALLCASHSGEPMHVQAVQSILAKAGCEERQLGCGCHVPMRYSLEDLPPAGAVFTQVHHNCSGKHAGFLAACVQHGWPSADYLNPAHPLQLSVRRSVAHFAGMAEAELTMGIDGCSAPNYAMPLSRLALSYARLAQGAPDAVYGEALATLRSAMTAHPELVSGTGRTDVAFMQTGPGDWVAKIGAEGVQVIGIGSAGLGIAVKIADGSARALCTVTVSVLQQLGLLADPAASPLAPWLRPQTRNYAGIRTGEVRAVFDLHEPA
ncbi:MAG: asparaginase [Herminiimonas sp.]|nr:asparaginase [Herminiimonas sp.]